MMNSQTKQYLTVRIGDQWCGINVNRIIEVLHLMAFKEIPTTRDDVLGFITVRDQVMPLIDMRRRFGIEDRSLKLDTPIVAVCEASGPIALLCDDTNRVEELDTTQISTLRDSGQFPDIEAIAKLGEQLILLLETEKLSDEIHSSTDHLDL